jgi:hypothetical protein
MAQSLGALGDTSFGTENQPSQPQAACHVIIRPHGDVDLKYLAGLPARSRFAGFLR